MKSHLARLFPRPRLTPIVFAFVLSIAGPSPRAAAAPDAWLDGRAAYVADSADDRVLRLVDQDGSGAIEPEAPGELIVFYDDESPGPDLSIASALLAGAGGEVYLLDGGTLDALLVLRDKDGDGSANATGEWGVFYDDSSPGPNLSTPGAIAFGPDGSIYLADDGSGAQRILRITDADGDGSANGAEEWRVVYDKTALAPTEGPLQDLEALAFLPGGALAVSESTRGRLYLLTDGNADGDFLDAGEAAVFYDPQGAHAFGHLTGLAAAATGEVFAADGDTGLVMRLLDLTGDGSATGPGEVFAFLDPARPPALGDVGDLAVDAEGTLVLLDRSRDSILLARDLDQDGLIGEGETRGWLADGGRSFNTAVAVAVGPAPPAPAVWISKIVPAEGPAAGGTAVRIEGRFPEPESAEVTFDGKTASIQSATSEAIDCLSPAASEGPADVRVATTAGQATARSGFRYTGGLFIRGDANLDGLLDISDAVGILGFLFLGGAPPSCPDALDADDDGVLSITDAIFYLSFLFQGGADLPPPGPQPGVDVTLDDLPCLPGR